MKLYRFTVIALFAALFSCILSGCAEELLDNREQDYGYVQFKLYKEASYPGSRAVIKTELDYLSEACKVKVTLSYGNTTIAQTLPLTAAGKEEAEFGLRSEKIKLLAGEYQVKLFSLFDVNDELIYNGSGKGAVISVIPGGLSVHDLTANVTPRGKVKFTLVKDVDTDLPNAPATKAPSREYTFDEIATFDITVTNTGTYEKYEFERLEGEFSIHFDENNKENGTPGYQTSSIVCDSLLSLPAGEYEVTEYVTYSSTKSRLEVNARPKQVKFTVEDNRVTEAKPQITLYESDEYIKDGYALYEIWQALDGPNWYASGEADVQGANWDFNKDPDLWCDQPGVQVHSNGRVARLSIGDFGFRGHMPAALGQLTEMVELYLGTHNDNLGNLTLNYDPSIAFDQSASERSAKRMENHKKYLSLIHPAAQMSEPCAWALSIKDIHIPANYMFEQGFKESEIFDSSTGHQIRPMDMNHGKLTNGLKSLPAEIGLLTNLEYLYIANGELEKLPDEVRNLVNLTDVEVYNCPKMTTFPTVIAELPKLISLNISNNSQWDATEIYKGLDAIANNDAGKSIQILYARENNLVEVPESFNKLAKIGLLDLAKNKIETLHPLGEEIAPVQLYLNENNISSIPLDNGIFCGINDTESINLSNNKLTEFPDMFNAKSKFIIGSVDFSFNQITGFPSEFKGVNVETFNLSCNPITKFPEELAKTNSKVSYIILRGCELDEIPEGCFDGKYSSYLVSLDLSYNLLTDLPKDFVAEKLPYLYGLDLSFNAFSEFPREPLSCSSLTVFAIRCQRDADGARTLRQWPSGITNHTGLRAFYIGSNDLRKVDDDIYPTFYMLDISDNPQITFDASNICYYWQAGAYTFIYDKTQNITGCDEMLR